MFLFCDDVIAAGEVSRQSYTRYLRHFGMQDSIARTCACTYKSMRSVLLGTVNCTAGTNKNEPAVSTIHVCNISMIYHPQKTLLVMSMNIDNHTISHMQLEVIHHTERHIVTTPETG